MKTRKLVISLAALSVAGFVAWLLFRPDTGGKSDSGDVPPPDKAGSGVAGTPAGVGNTTSPTSTASSSAAWIEKLHAAPQTVRTVIDPRLDEAGRLATARALPANLSDEEQQALLDFLKTRLPDDNDQPGHALKNDVMDALIRQEQLDPKVIETMAAVFQDSGQHVVLRDYAVQHLALAHERLVHEEHQGSGGDDALRSRIIEWLWQGVAEIDSSISGTALMGLSRLSEIDADIDQARLRSTAVELAGNPAAGSEARISALQVAGGLGAADILPTAVDIAAKGQSPALRLSAIGTMGMLGGRPVLDLLEQIAAENNRMLSHAALVASARINSRLNPVRDNAAGNP